MKHFARGLAAVALALTSASTVAAERVHMNRTVETLEAGDAVFGLFTSDFSLSNAMALSRSELDYIFIDMEHTPFDTETLRTFLLGMQNKRRMLEKGSAQMDVTPIVRIPMYGREQLQFMVKQVLDVGAFGVLFPFIANKEEAENAVTAMRYPPQRGDAQPEPRGVRGSSPGLAAWLWGVDDYMERADTWPLDPNGDLLAVLQIENVEGVENIEEIAAVPGVGAIFVGPADLALSYGVSGSSHPDMQAALGRVLAACKANNVPCGLTTSASTVEDYITEGWDFVTIGYWNDAGISPAPAEALARGRAAANRD